MAKKKLTAQDFKLTKADFTKPQVRSDTTRPKQPKLTHETVKLKTTGHIDALGNIYKFFKNYLDKDVNGWEKYYKDKGYYLPGSTLGKRAAESYYFRRGPAPKQVTMTLVAQKAYQQMLNSPAEKKAYDKVVKDYLVSYNKLHPKAQINADTANQHVAAYLLQDIATKYAKQNLASMGEKIGKGIASGLGLNLIDFIPGCDIMGNKAMEKKMAKAAQNDPVYYASLVSKQTQDELPDWAKFGFDIAGFVALSGVGSIVGKGISLGAKVVAKGATGTVAKVATKLAPATANEIMEAAAKGVTKVVEKKAVKKAIASKVKTATSNTINQVSRQSGKALSGTQQSAIAHGFETAGQTSLHSAGEAAKKVVTKTNWGKTTVVRTTNVSEKIAAKATKYGTKQGQKAAEKAMKTSILQGRGPLSHEALQKITSEAAAKAAEKRAAKLVARRGLGQSIAWRWPIANKNALTYASISLGMDKFVFPNEKIDPLEFFAGRSRDTEDIPYDEEYETRAQREDERAQQPVDDFGFDEEDASVTAQSCQTTVEMQYEEEMRLLREEEAREEQENQGNTY